MEKLVKKARRGNDEAFLILFQQYEAQIYRMAYVYVKDENDALDIVQETAYRSFKAIRSLKEPQYFKTWLLRIAIHSALDFLRKKEKVTGFEPIEADYIEGNFEDELLLKINLQDLINRLNEGEKTIVLLKYEEDLTFQEIANLLNMPLGSVKTILYQALKKLRQWKGDDLNV